MDSYAEVIKVDYDEYFIDANTGASMIVAGEQLEVTTTDLISQPEQRPTST